METKNTFEPACLDDFVFSHDETKKTLQRIVERKLEVPHDGVTGLLLYGTYGTGKSTLAKLLPTLIERSYGNFDNVLMNEYACASGMSGRKIITDIRDTTARVMCFTVSMLHYFILDEVDLLDAAAIKALKSLMNLKFSLFIMTTNDASRLGNGVLTRCQPLPMYAAPDEKFLPLLQRFAKRFGWADPDEDALLEIAKQAQGNVRVMARRVQTAALDRLDALGA